jgi:hypothetical protein
MKYSSQFTVLSFLFQDLSLELFSYSVVQFSLGFAALAKDFRTCLTPTALGLRFAAPKASRFPTRGFRLRCAAPKASRFPATLRYTKASRLLA